MNEPEFRIDRVKVGELVDFAAAILRRGARGVCPITPQRAHAHAHNPCADAADIALLVARREENIVGYLGLVPGFWRGSERRHKVYWISTLYVPKSENAHVIGAALLLECLRLGYDLVTS